MKSIDEKRLESDDQYHFQYMAEFIGFGAEDIKAITASGKLIAPMVPWLVNAVYEKLFLYDATKRHFFPRQSGYEGEIPQDFESVKYDHPVIKFRKDKLSRYLTRLVSGPYDQKMVEFLNFVGKMHTPKAGAETLIVPLVQMNALLGFVSDTLITALLGLNLPEAEKARTVRAFNKLLWIQNDLISRHYQDAAQWKKP